MNILYFVQTHHCLENILLVSVCSFFPPSSVLSPCYTREDKKRKKGRVAMKPSTVCLRERRKGGGRRGRGEGGRVRLMEGGREGVEVHIKVSYAVFVDGHP